MNLTIAICTYNKINYLKETLNCVLEKREEGDEIVVVDDGSSDGTVKFLKQANYRDFKTLFREDQGYTLASARNCAIEGASNNAILDIDDDDIITDGDISDLKEIFDPEYAVVLRRDYEANGEVQKDQRILDDGGPRRRKSTYKRDGLYLMKRGGNFVGYFWGPALYSKEMAEYVGKYNEEYNGNWGAEDADFATRLYFAGYPMLFYTGVRFVQREHERRDGLAEEQSKNVELLKKKTKEYKRKDKFSHYSETFHHPDAN